MADTISEIALETLAAKAAEAARLLKLLANERRLLVLCQLQGGEMTVGALARRVGLSQSALSQHLARLRRDGLVATRRERQTIHYRLADPAAAKVIGVLYELYCGPPTTSEGTMP